MDAVPDLASRALPATATPDVSIVIPVHNRVDLTRACLDSIFAHAEADLPHEILVVDDCSTDGTPDYLYSLGDRITVVRRETRGYFGHNINSAIQLARAEHLVLLNNDTEVTPHWLGPLVDAARRDPMIGVVGNRQLYPGTRKLNHAGMVFDALCRPVHLHAGLPAEFPPATVSRAFQAVTGACWLVPRAVFDELGGFDPVFRNGCEDVDFCLRARELGYKVWYAADSVIYHHVSSSAGRFDHETHNERHFASKWRDRIIPDQDDYLMRDGRLPPPPALAPALPRYAARKGSADLHLAVTLQHGNAFSWVVSQLAIACEAQGLLVSLPPGPIDTSIPAPIRSRLRKMMERPASLRAQIKWSHFWAPYWNQTVHGRINAEIFCTNYRYGPQPVHALDQWMRHTVLNANRKLPASRYCLEALTELGVPETRCRVLPYGYSPEILHETGADEQYRRHGLVFLALTNGHDPYRYGTDILLTAFSRAFAGRQDVVLVLKDYGGQVNGPLRRWLRVAGDTPRIIHLPEFLSKDALIRLYRGADAFVAPFRGEGFGMKVLDACAVGLPVLAPHYGGPADYLVPGESSALRFQEGPVGECLDRKEGVVPHFARWAEVDPDDLAMQMRAVAANIDMARLRAAPARDRVLQDYAWPRIAANLASTLDDFERERATTISARCLPASSDATISVIIPTYNRPHELKRTLEAYRSQTLPTDRWEIVLSDDGSNYDVGRHVAPFAEDLNIQLIANARQAGAGMARNQAIPQARGALVMFTGDDIVPAPGLLASHVARHRRYNDPTQAVLGYIDWHPDLLVTRLMRYITGAGGQQFAYQVLRPNAMVPYGYFYTSNVSLPRRLLQSQEELFSDKLAGYGFEDVELGLRLARGGMRLVYAPEAAATHLHAMSDDDIFRRQYQVGRALATYAMLHPQSLDPQHQTALRWLETFQHVLAHQPAFSAISGEIADAAASIAAALGGLAKTAESLQQVGPVLALQPAWAARLVGTEVAQFSRFVERLYGLQLELAQLDGTADAWIGVARAAPNPARDFLRTCLFASDRSLLAAGPALDGAEKPPLLYSMARRIRHHRLVGDVWQRCLRIPGALPVIEAGVGLLRRLP